MKLIRMVMLAAVAGTLSITACKKHDTPPPAPSLTTDSTALNLSYQQNSKDSFMVLSNVAWTITGLPSWATLSNASGTGNGKVYVTSSQDNNGTSPLTATLTVSAAALPSKTITLNQGVAAASIKSFSPGTLPSNDQTTPIVISGNFDPTITPVVKINGVQATVTAHSRLSISISLPSGATDGPITVTQGGVTLTSPANFLVTNRWALVSSTYFTPDRYIGAVSYTYNGKIYFGLGSNELGSVIYYNDFKVFDPSNNSFTSAFTVPSSMPVNGREYATCFTLNNKVYIIGGASYEDCWEYDPLASSWKQMNDAPYRASISVRFILNNIAYVQGSGNLYQFDPTANGGKGAFTFVMVGSFPNFEVSGVFVIGSYAYITGGQINAGPVSNQTYRFDPAGNTLTPVATLPSTVSPSSEHNLTFSLNGKGYLIDEATTYVFDPITNTWNDNQTATTPSINGGSTFYNTVVVNGVAYAIDPYGPVYKFIP